MIGIDRDGLHLLMWLRRGANNTLRLNQNALAAEFQITKHSMSRVVKRMELEARIVPAKGTRRNQTTTYVVADPDVWSLPAGVTGSSS